jgi:hypothetical protein
MIHIAASEPCAFERLPVHHHHLVVDDLVNVPARSRSIVLLLMFLKGGWFL